jgi:hypothetical protein
MRGVLGPRMVDKPSHHAKASFPLRWRRCARGPGHDRLPPDMGLRARRRKADKIAQQTCVDGQLEPGRPSYGEIAVERPGQHDASPSGHGCATIRNRATSTLA